MCSVVHECPPPFSAPFSFETFFSLNSLWGPFHVVQSLSVFFLQLELHFRRDGPRPVRDASRSATQTSDESQRDADTVAVMYPWSRAGATAHSFDRALEPRPSSSTLVPRGH